LLAFGKPANTEAGEILSPSGSVSFGAF
jgi:hypothetical protein